MDEGVEVVDKVVVVLEHVDVEEADFDFEVREVTDLLVEGFLAEEFLLLVVVLHDFHDILLHVLLLPLQYLD